MFPNTWRELTRRGDPGHRPSSAPGSADTQGTAGTVEILLLLGTAAPGAARASWHDHRAFNTIPSLSRSAEGAMKSAV